MQKFTFSCALLIALSIVAGCAGVGVVASADPQTKLSDATHLFDQQGRPLLAEQLIREAVASCEKSGDSRCLADAYRTYGFFFRSPSVGATQKYYEENGFLDTSATFAGRYAASIAYFQKARDLYAGLGLFDVLTNVDLNMGFSHELAGDNAQACRNFDAAAADYAENRRRNPDANVALPNGVTSFEEFLVPHRTRAGCR